MAARSHKRRLVLARVPLSLYASARQLEESCRGPIWKGGGGGLCVPVGKTRTVLYLSTAREYIYIRIYMSGEEEKEEEEGRDQSAVKVPPERRRADLSSTFFFSPFTFPFFLCVMPPF
jgi:hypothetical protein